MSAVLGESVKLANHLSLQIRVNLAGIAEATLPFELEGPK
jgi:hypothetical protein